ncbi:hypothetical protein ACIA8F_21180 [Streptomyces sp. NPDC051563]|uniref:hypothetical protein n=1 Tax=Streptomyces sp. NPDC051563 TaxID=3365659 RepID=UPI00379E6734
MERTTWREHASGTEPGRYPGEHSAAIGLLAGMALAFAGYFGGFFAFLLVVVMGAAGWVTGLALEGRLDLGALLGARRGRR